MTAEAEVVYTSAQLARWGLLDSARREAVRDRLMASVGLPPDAVLAVLRQQWLQDQGLGGVEAQARWLACRGLGPGDLEALLARPWRWQQWCERHYGASLASTFLARKAGLDRVRYWCLELEDPDLASELYQRLREGECGFDQLALEARAGAPWQVELVGPVALGSLPVDLARLLRVSEEGVLCALQRTAAGGWQLLRLEQHQPACLDQTLRAQLLQSLGEAALDQAMGSPQG